MATQDANLIGKQIEVIKHTQTQDSQAEDTLPDIPQAEVDKHAILQKSSAGTSGDMKNDNSDKIADLESFTVDDSAQIKLQDIIGAGSLKANQVQEQVANVDNQIGESNQEEVDPALAKEQIKWFAQFIKSMKKKKDAFIFLNPVNPVALNIPTYFTVIQRPMDISVIEKKIRTYSSIKEAQDDVDLMLTNCTTFNGPVSPITQMAKNLQSWYLKEFEKCPKTLKRVDKKSKKPDAAFENRSRRESFRDEGKRRTPSKRESADLKFCNYVHREVTRKQYAAFVWPFMTPVDADALGIPHYKTVITRPMDLSTIRKKLDLSEYLSADEFEQDFKLMINNCYTFNTAGTDIHGLGKQLEQLFETKWDEKSNFIAQQSENKLRDHSEDEDDDAQQIQMLRTQISLLDQQLQTLLDKTNKKKKRRAMQPTSYPNNVVSQQPKAKKNPEKKKKKRPHPPSSDDEKMPDTDITYEQKRELSDNINILPPDKLPQVFEIIKENTQLNAAEDDEIELDIDSLDKSVLWKLYLFVKKHTRPPKKAKLDEEQVAGSSSSESDSDESVVKSTDAGTSKPDFKKRSTKAIKKAESPIQFRTEKGDVTNYTSMFVAQAVVDKKVVAPRKPKYDSVLDSAWNALESISKIDPTPIVEPISIPKISKLIDTLKEEEDGVIVDSNSDGGDIDYYQAPLDLDGAKKMQAFQSEITEEDIQSFQGARDAYAEKCLGDLETLDWVLNDEVESDEEGAI